MSSSEVPVEEELCEVKLVDTNVPSLDTSGCKCCHSHEFKSKEASTHADEEICQVKSTYYSRLSNRFFRNIFHFAPKCEIKAEEDFRTLRKKSISRKQLFVDEKFPPINESITFNGITNRQYEWKRPKDIVKEPQFFVEGATRFDIQQGELGDCWLLAAVSTLTLNPRQFQLVVPNDQDFHTKYAGIFHFRFWQNGKWEDIIIDDLLPTYRGHLVFMHSKTENEFWCALLEKAYAKMYGCYESLKGGNVNESMVDLTGGVVERIELKEVSRNLFGKMKAACNRGAMIGCGIERASNIYSPPEGRLSNGLITSHAYSVTKVTTISFHQNTEDLVRLHNPWGNEAEWKGAWSDQSSQWNSVCLSERNALGITFDDDGEFWMPFKDFVSNFTSMDICEITPDIFTMSHDSEEESDSLQQLEIRKHQWRMKMHQGDWIPGISAGGCRNYLETFIQNPQKVVLLDKPAEGSEDCTLVVSLMQTNVRQRKRYGIDYIPIGFSIYRLPPGIVPGVALTKEFFMFNTSCGRAPFFLNTRELTHHFQLPPGVYVVIPSSFEPNIQAQYLLRIFTESYSR